MSFTKINGGGGQDAAITDTDVFAMADHWLNTPTNGYLGSDYGSNPKGLLQKPLQGLSADGFIRKLKKDVPLIGRASPDTVNVLSDTTAPDGLNLYLELGGKIIKIGNQQ